MPDIFDEVSARSTGDVFDQLSPPIIEGRGGLGYTVSREEAKKIAAQRLVERNRQAGLTDLLTKEEATTLAQQAGVPVGNIGEVVSTRQFEPSLEGNIAKAIVGLREGASQALFGIPGAAQRVAEDALMNEALKSIIGSQALKQRAPEIAIAGGTVGQLIPSGLIGRGVTVPVTLGQKVLQGALTGAGIGGTVSGAGALEREGLNQPISNLLTETAVGTGLGALLGGTIPAVSPLTQSLSKTLRESAEKNVGQALLPTTLETKAATERITPEILNRPMRETFAFTKKGLQEKSEAQREIAGEAINTFGKLEGETDPSKISSALESLKKPYTIEGKVIDQGAIDNISNLQGVFDQYGDSISREGLRSIRRVFDKQIKESKGFFKDIKQGTELELKKVAANEIREVLASEVPDLAVLNKQYNFWSNLDNVISKTVERTKPQQGFTANVAAIAGAATGVGPADMALRAIVLRNMAKAAQSPGWKLLSARIKNNISKSLVESDPEAIVKALESGDKATADSLRLELNQLREATRNQNIKRITELAEGIPNVEENP